MGPPWYGDGQEPSPEGGGFPDQLTAIGNSFSISEPTTETTEMVWKSDGTSSGTVMVRISAAEVAAVFPTGSLSSVAPYISQPTMEPTEMNCGRATGPPRAR